MSFGLRMKKWFVAVVMGTMAFLLAGRAEAGPFPAGPADDTTQTLGLFMIKVAPAFQPSMAAMGLPTSGMPSYNPVTHIFTSPFMYDPATVIGRSDVFPSRQPGGPDFVGASVGTAGTIVSDQDFINIGKFLPGLAPGTREIHTELRNLTATGGGFTLRAGSGMGLPVSPGEIESLSGNSGDPNQDFPAQSFFDVFVQIDVPGLGTLLNKDALFVTQLNLTALPPVGLVYVHDKTNPVDMLFGPNTNFPGDVFGSMILAGHGVGLPNNQTGQTILLNALGIPEPSTITVLMIGVGGLAGWRWLRQRHAAPRTS